MNDVCVLEQLVILQITFCQSNDSGFEILCAQNNAVITDQRGRVSLIWGIDKVNNLRTNYNFEHLWLFVNHLFLWTEFRIIFGYLRANAMT